MHSTSTCGRRRRYRHRNPRVKPGVTRCRGLVRRDARLTPRKTHVARRGSSRGNGRRLRPSSVRMHRPGSARSCVSLQKSLSNVRLHISPRPAPRKRWLARVNGGLVEEDHSDQTARWHPQRRNVAGRIAAGVPATRSAEASRSSSTVLNHSESYAAIWVKAWMVRPHRKGANRSKGPQRWKAPWAVYKLVSFTGDQHTQSRRLLSPQHHRESESSEETRVPDNGTRGNGRGDRGVRGSVRVPGKTWGKQKAPWEIRKNPRAFSRTRRSDLDAVKHQVSGQVKPNPKVGFTRTE